MVDRTATPAIAIRRDSSRSSLSAQYARVEISGSDVFENNAGNRAGISSVPRGTPVDRTSTAAAKDPVTAATTCHFDDHPFDETTIATHVSVAPETTENIVLIGVRGSAKNLHTENPSAVTTCARRSRRHAAIPRHDGILFDHSFEENVPNYPTCSAITELIRISVSSPDVKRAVTHGNV